MSEPTSDPFAPIPDQTPPEQLEREAHDRQIQLFRDRTFHKINKQGEVLLCKMESGVPVIISNLGSVKEQIQQALLRMAMMPAHYHPTEEDLENMTKMDAAAFNLIHRAAIGDQDAFTKILDRVMGKPKQTSENVNVTINIDEVLAGSNTPPPKTIEAERYEGP